MQVKQNNETKVEAAFASISQLGHFKPLIPFMKELKERGHTVTVFVPKEEKFKRELENEGVMQVNIIETEVGSTVKSSSGPLNKISGGLYTSILSYYQDKKNPDVIVYDHFATAMADVADKMKIPAISVSNIPLCFHDKPPKHERSLTQNISLSLRSLFLTRLVYSVLRAFRNSERKERNLPKLNFQDIMPDPGQERHAISTTADGFEFIEEKSPLLQQVGPTPPSSPTPLGTDLSQWLNEQEKPVVYVAFGTLHVFDKVSLRNLTQELKNVSHKCSLLWSLPKDQQSLLEKDKIPSNCRIEKFVPQWSVLNHPNVKCFVSHCGSGSTHESILNSVPLVCCPTGKDQFANATRVKVAGAGVVVKNGANGSVSDAIHKVYDNLTIFEEATKKVKENLLKAGGAKKAADIIEIIAERGYEELGEVKPLKL